MFFDEQRKYKEASDVISNEIFVNALCSSGKVAVMVSEEDEQAIIVEKGLRGKYCVAFDPLDGSSNIDAGVNVVTIFGIYEHEGSTGSISDVLRPGDWRIYPNIKIPSCGKIYSVNEEMKNIGMNHVRNISIRSNIKYPPEGKSLYSACYIGSMVADVYCILLYGGIFAYPADKKSKNAGGKAINSKKRALDLVPESIHSRCPIFLGSKDDIEDIEKFYADFNGNY
nr:10838_t:CDS:2 [Entrophospora candida]CAG8572518.1 3670_t:CDS:2 [Entrophospora candida]